jgi:hypothetical protein
MIHMAFFNAALKFEQNGLKKIGERGWRNFFDRQL